MGLVLGVMLKGVVWERREKLHNVVYTLFGSFV